MAKCLMARIRQLKPEFWTDDKIAGLSRDARLLFLGLLTEADDDGRLVDSPKLLAGSLFPFDNDVTTKKLSAWLDEVTRLGLVRRYVRGAASYLYIVNFKRHQKIAHPRRSSLPPPDNDPHDAGVPHEESPRDAAEPQTKRAPDLGVKGSRGQGVKGVGVDNSSSSRLNSVAPALDDDDEGTPIDRTLNLIARRRYAVAEAKEPIKNPGGYWRTVRRSVNLEVGDEVEKLLCEGHEPDAIVEMLCPTALTAPNPYAELPELEYVDYPDGSVRLIRATGSAS